jgi:hypothetical protein
MRRRESVGAVIVCLGIASVAHAGRTRFGWLYDTETIPERGVELETWYLEEDGKGEPDVDETAVLWMPVVGVTDRIELAFPFELKYEREEGAADTRLERLGAEVRWRLTDPDPVERGPFAPLLRLGVKRMIAERSVVRIEGDVVLSYEAGRVLFVIDVGGIAEVNEADGEAVYEVRPAAGLSVRATTELRFGAELYSEIGLEDHPGVDWYSVGPNIAWTHGRFWLAGSFPIGLKNIDAAPRLNFAIAF